MADSAKDSTEGLSQNDMEKNLRKAAEAEIAKAMDGAFANLPVDGEGSAVKEQSSFLRKNLSEEKQPVEKEVEYVKPMPDPYGKAITYLEQHNVMQLFQQLTASIVYNKPEKPLEFMMSEVEKLKKLKDEEGGKK